jgi:antirestriction protein ArdC
MASFALGGDPRFCSYKQAADHGWQVRKGERGATIFYFERMLVEDRNAAPGAEDGTRAVPMLRTFTVCQRRDETDPTSREIVDPQIR